MPGRAVGSQPSGGLLIRTEAVSSSTIEDVSARLEDSAPALRLR
ncbi:hypothetical protein EV639_10814 [Rathayibacter tanaceti]|uniref:Uncharacterized protein n=2 Tax=Rathayibacter tanaceti TaxID=1671680 RepID=A0ACD2XHV6_9MICO|nr:hypothetical protein ACH61_02549 [Rathayibacter tanaceti]TCO36149.1 hypothetical protein EV639_10814 [Rathayibacter tanaceti]